MICLAHFNQPMCLCMLDAFVRRWSKVFGDEIARVILAIVVFDGKQYSRIKIVSYRAVRNGFSRV